LSGKTALNLCDHRPTHSTMVLSTACFSDVVLVARTDTVHAHLVLAIAHAPGAER